MSLATSRDYAPMYFIPAAAYVLCIGASSRIRHCPRHGEGSNVGSRLQASAPRQIPARRRCRCGSTPLQPAHHHNQQMHRQHPLPQGHNTAPVLQHFPRTRIAGSFQQHCSKAHCEQCNMSACVAMNTLQRISTSSAAPKSRGNSFYSLYSLCHQVSGARFEAARCKNRSRRWALRALIAPAPERLDLASAPQSVAPNLQTCPLVQPLPALPVSDIHRGSLGECCLCEGCDLDCLCDLTA